MKVVLINLTRFGDLLQMQPTILGLEAQGHEVALVCLDNFAAAATLLRGITHVFAVPGGSLLQQIELCWPLAVHYIENFVAYIESKFCADIVINTTASLGARLLARRINSNIDTRTQKEPSILGFALDTEGFGQSGNMWATFLQGASVERLNSPFNIVDMFRAIACVDNIPTLWGLQKTSPSIAHTSQTFLADNICTKYTGVKKVHPKGFIAFQLGASDTRRQWPVTSFAALGQQLWHELALCPVLLGSPAEQDLAEAYSTAIESMATNGTASPFVNAIGKTDIPHLAGMLEQCLLLVSNDTGTMHLAAGLGVPVLGIFLATAQAWDTGPYMPQCCCLEPAMPCHPCAFHQPCVHTNTTCTNVNNTKPACAKNTSTAQPCLQRISAKTVFSLVSTYIQYGTWPQSTQTEARVWLTMQDKDGFANLHCLSEHEQEERTQWIRQQKFFYRRILDNVKDTAHTSPPYKAPSAQGLSPTLRQEAAQVLARSAALLLLLEEHIELLRRTASARSGEKVVSTSQRIHTTLHQYPPLKTLGHLWTVLSQEQSGDLTSLKELASSLRIHFLCWQQNLETYPT